MSTVNLKDNPSPPGPPPPPSICTSGAVRGENLGESIGVSLLNLTGLGGLFNIETPMDKLQKQIQEIKDKTQQVINKSTAIFAGIQTSIDEEFISDFQAIDAELHSYVDFQNEVLNEKITKNLIYIIGSFFLLLVTIVFLLISNAFKR